MPAAGGLGEQILDRRGTDGVKNVVRERGGELVELAAER
jgi:hypothetical protein